MAPHQSWNMCQGHMALKKIKTKREFRCHGVCMIGFMTIMVKIFSLLNLKLYLLKDYSSVTQVSVIDIDTISGRK